MQYHATNSQHQMLLQKGCGSIIFLKIFMCCQYISSIATCGSWWHFQWSMVQKKTNYHFWYMIRFAEKGFNSFQPDTINNSAFIWYLGYGIILLIYQTNYFFLLCFTIFLLAQFDCISYFLSKVRYCNHY